MTIRFIRSQLKKIQSRIGAEPIEIERMTSQAFFPPCSSARTASSSARLFSSPAPKN